MLYIHQNENGDVQKQFDRPVILLYQTGDSTSVVTYFQKSINNPNNKLNNLGFKSG